LDEIIIEPEEKLLIDDFIPCKISDDKVTFNKIINTTLQLGIVYTDYPEYNYDYKYVNVLDYHISKKIALLSPNEVQKISTDKGIFEIKLPEGEKWKERSTGEKTTFTNINELYLQNSGDEPLEFKSGDIVVIRATLDK